MSEANGPISICSYCNKISDYKGYWNKIEGYITDHPDTLFSHGICPECAEKTMKEFKESLK